MTELEAEALAARLTRIWVPEQDGLSARPVWKLDGLSTPKKSRKSRKRNKDRHGWMSFIVDIGDVTFEMNLFEGGFFSLKRQEGVVVTGELYCPRDSGIILDVIARPEMKSLYEQFAAQWLPFFRRNCWLSGCDIEASAHEKAEWIRGFTREEIESWNLKF